MKRLVLVGAGHAHGQVLQDMVENPFSGVEVIAVSPEILTPYSGMIPGWFAGHYTWEECCVDAEHLCRKAQVRFMQDRVVGLNADEKVIRIKDRGELSYDWLSLNIGSTLTPPFGGDVMVIPLRPLDDLRKLWGELQQRVRALGSGERYRIAMIGGGAAGVETMLGMRHSLRRLAPNAGFEFTLATHDDAILSGMAQSASRRLRKRLENCGVKLVTGFQASRFEAGTIVSSDGQQLLVDALFWATGAEAYEWPVGSGLSFDRAGFVEVDQYMRSISHPNVFAAGDCAGWQPPLPKAGVFAVRMGPTLAHNLRAAIAGAPLKAYQPQRRFLTLIGTGGENAVAAWGDWSFEGGWAWRWKQAIDRNFIARRNR